AQITSEEGDIHRFQGTDYKILNAPYRGTINWLREQCLAYPYGEVRNIVLPQGTGVKLADNTPFEMWAEPAVNGAPAWDRSLLRLYSAADASGREIDLTGATEAEPHILTGY